MKVLLFAPYGNFSPHSETELEIIERHLDEQDDVTVLTCYSDLLLCDVQMPKDYGVCLSCVARRHEGFRRLRRNVRARSFIYLTQQERLRCRAVGREILCSQNISGYKLENFDLGYGVLSSLVSWLREPNLDLDEPSVAALVSAMAASAAAVYFSLRNHLKDGYDKVYVFNGRFAIMRAVLRACEAAKVDCYVHERGHDLSSFGLFANTMPHDMAYLEKQIRERWQGADDEERSRIAALFYHERHDAVIQSWHSFTKDQMPNLLPVNWNPVKRNVTIFHSCEDEFAAISDEWKNPLYPTQAMGLALILRDSERLADKMHLYLRIHPNLKDVKTGEAERLFSLNGPTLTVIPPDSPISSYALMRSSDAVVTFGSTIGIEAAYWDKPSILAGPSYYSNLGSTYNPPTHNELMALLAAILLPKDKLGALMYGYYMRSFGIPFRYINPKGVCEVEFKGQTIRPSRLWNRLIRLYGSHALVARLTQYLGDKWSRSRILGFEEPK